MAAVDLALAAYFFALGLAQMLLFVLSARALQATKVHRFIDVGTDLLDPHTLPEVALIVPAFNEEATIVQSVKALLQIDYPSLQIIVVNDGSRDDTLRVLQEAFCLERCAYSRPGSIPTQPVLGFHRSGSQPNLCVIDKKNGGKADALNAGIEAARAPLVCCIDADTIVDRLAITRMTEPFLFSEVPVVAVGGCIQIANGSTFEDGVLQEARLSRSMVARTQALEYLRAFVFFRMGLAEFNANVIISGALGMFRRSAVIEVGGYSTSTVGEDMELVVRLHAHFRRKGAPFIIDFRPDAVGYTEAPDDYGILIKQRDRWQRGLIETLVRHRSLMWSKGGGVVGRVVLPYYWLYEVFAPFVEAFGLAWATYSVIEGRINVTAAVLCLAIALLAATIVSVHTLILDELDRRAVRDPRSRMMLILTAMVEPFIHRPIITFARLEGTMRLLRGERGWGRMRRRGFATSETT